MEWTREKVRFCGFMGLLASGLCVSIMSLAGICSDACSEAHKYAILKAPVAALGIGFFLVAMAVWWFAQSKVWAQTVFPYVLATAAGAEAGFILFQHLVIGHFCTLCLWVGAVVVVALGAWIIDNFTFRRTKMKIFSILSSILPKAIICFAAFLFVLVTLKKPVEGSNLPDPFLGSSTGQVEMFVVTDWFCPACQKLEPTIEAAAKEAMKVGRVTFIDFAVHPETFNFSPYNLSFSMYEKTKYLALRKSLGDLARQTKTPTPAEVQAKVTPLNVKLHTLNFNEAMQGVQFYQKIVSTFKVTSTPTVIVRHIKSGKMVMLNGRDIAAGKIPVAMKQVLAVR
jgi:thiol-disulfide isomerase/thioredoxin